MDRGTARERVWTWQQAGAAARAGVAGTPNLGWLTQGLASVFRAAIAAEAAPGRLVPWVPIAFGLGVAIYFTAEREPSWIAATLLAAAAILAALLARRRAFAFAGAALIAAAAVGFGAVSLKSALIAHPVLERPANGVSIAGFIEMREERERSDR